MRVYIKRERQRAENGGGGGERVGGLDIEKSLGSLNHGGRIRIVKRHAEQRLEEGRRREKEADMEADKDVKREKKDMAVQVKTRKTYKCSRREKF